jgi:hypothetical protein
MQNRVSSVSACSGTFPTSIILDISDIPDKHDYHGVLPVVIPQLLWYAVTIY